MVLLLSRGFFQNNALIYAKLHYPASVVSHILQEPLLSVNTCGVFVIYITPIANNQIKTSHFRIAIN